MNFCCRIMFSSSRHENLGVWVLIAMVSYLDFSPAYPKWSDFLSSERYRANSQQRRRHLRQISFKFFLERASISSRCCATNKNNPCMAHTINRVLQPCGEFFSRALPIPFGNFYPLAPHPLGISIDHHGGEGEGVWTISGITHSVYKIYTCRIPGEEYPQSHSGVQKWVLPQSCTPSVLYSYSWCQVTSVLYIVWGTLVLHSPAVNVRIYCTNQTTAGLQEQLFELDI